MIQFLAPIAQLNDVLDFFYDVVWFLDSWRCVPWENPWHPDFQWFSHPKRVDRMGRYRYTHNVYIYIYKIDGLIVCILSHEYTEYTLYLPIPANSIIFHHPPGSLKTIVPGSRERPSHVRGQAHGPIGPPSSPWNGPSDEWIIGIYPDGWMDG